MQHREDMGDGFHFVLDVLARPLLEERKRKELLLNRRLRFQRATAQSYAPCFYVSGLVTVTKGVAPMILVYWQKMVSKASSR